jgi:hypothetical protein
MTQCRDIEDIIVSSATNAEHSDTNAEHSATNAEHSATNAEHSATNAEHSATNAEHITKNLFQYMTHYYSHPKSKHLFIKEVPNSKSKVRYYKVLL